MIEIGIVGSKNSGKTTLVETLIEKASKDGYNIVTIKHTSHSHTFDTPGKDSFRHREAGASATIAISEKEMALFTTPNLEQVNLFLINMLDTFDICLVEGDKKSIRPKVLLTNNFESIKDKNPSNIIATYGDEPLDLKVKHFSRSDTDKLYMYLKEIYFSNTEVVND